MNETESARASVVDSRTAGSEESLEAYRQRLRVWSVSGTMAISLGVASTSLAAVLSESAWWFPLMVVVLVVLGASATFRVLVSRISRAWVASVVAALFGGGALLVMFAGGTALGGVIPSAETFRRFGELVALGESSILGQRFPAEADTGIVFLVCLGMLAVSVAMDVAVFVVRRPALTAIPLLIVFLVPSFVHSELHDAFVFAATAVSYVGILIVASEKRAVRVAGPLVAAALVLSLIVPVVLPSVEPVEPLGDRAGLISTGINPIINLSSDLRRNTPLLALTYTSDSGGEYLRVAALDDFSDDTWSPSSEVAPSDNNIETFAVPPGLTPAIPRTESVMQIEVERIRGKLLPVPYATTRITGTTGQWAWEPEALTVSTESSNSRNQRYEVEFISPAPTIDQLRAAPTELPEGFEKYLALPAGLPDSVSETAAEIVGAEASQFDQAIALQTFFANGDFRYSEDAPIAANYDGSGAAALGEFLTAKSGYCVHFASAMAAMARSLEIPSRVVVGFTPGQKSNDSQTDELRYTVSTENLHAWPELFFPTVGWVRFEPTVSVGSAPRFAQSLDDDPSTPDVDESQPEPEPAETPTSSAPPPERPDLPAEEQEQSDSGGAATVSGWWWLALAVPVLLFIPATVRSIRRHRRLRATARGEALPAWREIQDTAIDLGYVLSSTATPRQQREQLAGNLTAGQAATVSMILASVEQSAFGARNKPVRLAAVTETLTALRASAGWRARLTASLAPRTVFGRRE